MGNVMTTHFLPFSSFHENNHWKSRKGLKMVPKKSRCCPKDLIFAFVVLFWGRSWIPNPVLVLLYSLHSICILPNPVLVLLYSLHSICILPSLHILLSLHSLYIFTVSAVSTVCTVSTLSTVSTVMLTSFTCASSGHFSSIVKFLFSGYQPCCNHLQGYCGRTTDHCLCESCKNYHYLFLQVLTIIAAAVLIGIVFGGLISFGLYKYRNRAAAMQKRTDELKKKKQEQKKELQKKEEQQKKEEKEEDDILEVV